MLVYSLPSLFGSVSTSPSQKSLCDGIAQGTDLANRTGRSIRLVSVDWSGTLVGGQSNLSTDDKYNTVRIVVWYGVSGAGTPGFSVSGYLDPRYFNQVQRIIFDKKYTLKSFAPDSTGYMPAVLEVRESLRLNDLIQFSGTGTGVESGMVPYITIMSDSLAAPSPGFVTGSLAVRFTD